MSPEIPPSKLLITDLAELLKWFEENLCGKCFRDPRGHEVRFDCSRFPYMIKLVNTHGQKLNKPAKIVERIKAGKLGNADFGGYSVERAHTLCWIPATILRPTYIARNKSLVVPGQELYVKEFEKRGYKYKVLHCIRVSDRLLVPVSSFPRSKLGSLEIIWP
jgi:hypothetical protein